MKLFTHQELERTVSYRRERKDLKYMFQTLGLELS